MQRKVLVTGPDRPGCPDFCTLCAGIWSPTAPRCSISTRLLPPGNLQYPGDDRQCAELPLRQDQHLRPARGGRGVGDLPFQPRHPSRRRKARRSLDHARRPFIQTNIVGAYDARGARAYWHGLSGGKRDAFRFLHVSTDEVYGSLGESGAFVEETPYDPNSPYSASKAAADHLVSAWTRTYGFPAVISIARTITAPIISPRNSFRSSFSTPSTASPCRSTARA